VRAVGRWQARKEQFEREQPKRNEWVDPLRSDYLAGKPEAVSAYCKIVLSRCAYPRGFPDEVEVEYNPDSGIIVVERALPAPEQIPRLREVKYVRSRGELSESYLPDREVTALYDDALYQIALATAHALYDADCVGALVAMVFNGYVTAIDKATGNELTTCVMSVQISREEFARLDLAAVDPKACFRQLKGVAASKLHAVTPIAPVLSISREDKRFVASHEVAADLDDSSNLAAMDWEDFEHLIRELFEREFSEEGGEVKVTRASRDGGIDAIAFDPDPLRGGRIAIQAKRYTNPVGVSAVRDLYGTVLHEGATKGILVTTSEYGPDSYEFAKDKPLTLLNGSNLLYLLQKHGYRAKIDIAEAKRILAEREAAERRGE